MLKNTIDGISKLIKGIRDKLTREPIDDINIEPTLPTEEAEKAVDESVLKPKGEMRMSREGKAMLTHLEGICLTRYLCSSNVWTIGIGATGTEIKDIKQWPRNKSITVQEAFELLDKSLHRYERAIRKALKVEVPQHAFDALVSWCYNVGIGWAPKATVIKLINKGVPVSNRRVYNALMRYKKPPTIIGRRKKEARLLTKGIYAGDFKANLAPVNSRGRPIYSKGKQIDLREYL